MKDETKYLLPLRSLDTNYAVFGHEEEKISFRVTIPHTEWINLGRPSWIDIAVSGRD